MKDWKFVALWAVILVSGFVGLLLGMTMGIPIVGVVGGYLVWVSFFVGLGLIYRGSKRGRALAYNITLVCAVSGFLLIMVGKITGIQTVEGVGLALFFLAAVVGVQLQLRRAWQKIKVVDNHEIKE